MAPWGSLSPTGLVAWWSLGEGGGPWPTDAYATPDFSVDWSGNGRNLTAMNNYRGTLFITDPADPRLPVTSVTPASRQDFDGGAVRFRLSEFQWIAFWSQLCFQSNLQIPEYNLHNEGVGSGNTVAFWTAHVPYTDTVYVFAPFTGDISEIGTWPFLFGDWGHQFGIRSGGTRAGFDPYTGAFEYFTQDSDLGDLSSGTYGGAYWRYTSDPLSPYVWHHMVCTLEKTAGSTGTGDPTARYRRRFYLDASLVADLEGTAYEVAVSAPENQFTLGGAWSDDIRFAHCAGQLDEFSIWHRTLTQDEITLLFHAGRGVFSPVTTIQGPMLVG